MKIGVHHILKTSSLFRTIVWEMHSICSFLASNVPIISNIFQSYQIFLMLGTQLFELECAVSATWVIVWHEDLPCVLRWFAGVGKGQKVSVKLNYNVYSALLCDNEYATRNTPFNSTLLTAAVKYCKWSLQQGMEESLLKYSSKNYFLHDFKLERTVFYLAKC